MQHLFFKKAVAMTYRSPRRTRYDQDSQAHGMSRLSFKNLSFGIMAPEDLTDEQKAKGFNIKNEEVRLIPRHNRKT
jgi:hypothetical protein